MEVLFTPINRKTWVEELHAWLQFNPLAVDIVLVAARQVPIITAAKHFQDGKYNFMDCELVLSVQRLVWTTCLVRCQNEPGRFQLLLHTH